MSGDSTHSSPTVLTKPTCVVGVGASAGGLEALERLFEQMPIHTGLAFVVVQHLSPDFRSLTDELLARRTSIPIFRVENGMEIRPDAIYLIPPRKDMILSAGQLHLTDKDPAQFVAMPIDHFFRSLAHEQGEHCVGIVLSGTGSDGSRGIREIHEAGGLVIAQTPESAKFDGMPRSAIETGSVHLMLAPEQIPDALLRHIKHPLAPSEPPHPEISSAGGLDTILHLLRDTYSIDFTHYKPDTVTRRIDRRLLLSQSVELEEYAQRVAADPDELNQLYKDLLIGVTRFFRDEEAFDRLQQDVLPGLLARLAPDEEFRAWVAGCATGEEAYSLAILLREGMDSLPRPIPVKIFATDVHRASLDFASAGVYSESNLSGLPPRRLERFFTRRGDHYQVTPELRKMVVFAPQNVIKDAPFTKLDLISCRNLLIYFLPAVQKKVLALFHFGLRTNGALLLGPSESPGELGDEFDTIDSRWKIYRKRRDVRLNPDIRVPAAPWTSRPRPSGQFMGGMIGNVENPMMGVYDALLDQFLPPSLLVSESREIVQVFAGGSRFLRLRDGRFSSEVLDMVDTELRMALSGALLRVLKEMTPVVYKGLHIQLPEGDKQVNVSVRPVRHVRSSVVHTLISFEEVDALIPTSSSVREIDLDQASKEQVLALEAELRHTKENLQAMIEELETSNEELQATNEELVASNEELQSTNEELHSVNEELYTVNAEYQNKITQLTELTTDMDNLLTSTEVHTIFLDRNLCIRKFTPKIAETFNLLPQDVGRRIDNFTYTIDHPGLLDDLQTVLSSSSALERQVRDRRGNWYLLRVLPYRAGLGIDGVVLTLVDVTGMKKAGAQARLKDEQLRGILRNSPNWVFIRDRQGRYVLADESFRKAVNCDPIGKTAHDLFPLNIADILTMHDKRVLEEGVEEQSEVVIPLPDGPHNYLSVKFPVRDEEGRIIGVGGIKTDVTQLKHAERQAREALRQRDRFLAVLSHELRNPLAAILNAASAVDQANALPDEVRHWLDVIERRSRHMARLLEDLLDVSRITQNKIEIRKVVFNLASTIPDVLEEVRHWFAERELTLINETGSGPMLVEGDPDRLQQIQVNLLMNAAKYTPAGGKVWYVLGREEDQVVIRVSDTGVGLMPEMLNQVFDLFTQVDETLDRSAGGIGVGLTLVRAIVELHGGTVEAHSDGPGTGSEFIVRLPMATGPIEDAIPPPARKRARACQGTGQRVLVVEDDPDIRESLRRILQLDGFHVRVAENGLEALAVAEADFPQVAVIDIGIPGLDGYELARRFRERYPRDLLLVALTGYGQPSDRQAAFEAGFDEHLTKPFSPTALARLLSERTIAVETSEAS